MPEGNPLPGERWLRRGSNSLDYIEIHSVTRRFFDMGLSDDVEGLLNGIADFSVRTTVPALCRNYMCAPSATGEPAPAQPPRPPAQVEPRIAIGEPLSVDLSTRTVRRQRPGEPILGYAAEEQGADGTLSVRTDSGLYSFQYGDFPVTPDHNLDVFTARPLTGFTRLGQRGESDVARVTDDVQDLQRRDQHTSLEGLSQEARQANFGLLYGTTLRTLRDRQRAASLEGEPGIRYDEGNWQFRDEGWGVNPCGEIALGPPQECAIRPPDPIIIKDIWERLLDDDDAEE